ncbi:hypothetical protein ACI6PS_00110 [Flavobacterium sp. PLA-1-15]|uniref:hypothetical protein n=1 Tax=Flavobacterium sp. PLA-1-15 TaxID=3380533 RepID=UPI003B7A9DD9
MFVSCGSDDNGGGTPAATSIVLTASATTIDLGQPVTLTAKDNNGNDVTARATFYDGTTVITSPYTPSTTGAHSLTAKLDNLTSASVIVTVNAVAATNAVFFEGENFDVNQSAAVFWGGYDQDGDGTADHALWSVLVFVGTDISTASSADSAQYVDVEFLTALDAEGGVVLPTVANAIYLDIYEMWLDSTEVPVDGQGEGSLVLSEDLTNDLTATSFVATCDVAGSPMEINYDGSFLGIFDASARPAAAKGTKVKNVVTLAQVAKAKAKLYNSLKK